MRFGGPVAALLGTGIAFSGHDSGASTNPTASDVICTTGQLATAGTYLIQWGFGASAAINGDFRFRWLNSGGTSKHNYNFYQQGQTMFSSWMIVETEVNDEFDVFTLINFTGTIQAWVSATRLK